MEPQTITLARQATLFADGQMQAAAKHFDDKLADAINTIYRLFRAGHPVYCGFSGGKDSATTVDLALRAAVRAKRDGAAPVLAIGSADTLVENPEVDLHRHAELARMRAFALQHGIELTTAVTRPTLAASWQVSILSGRSLPTFPGSHGECTTDYKLAPQFRLRKRLYAEWRARGLPEPVTLLGVRTEESAVRAANMETRGYNASTTVRNEQGHLVLAPIADWTELDVFEHMGNIANGLLTSYSDFKDTLRIYAHAAATGCAVVAIDTHATRKLSPCQRRLGCWACTRVERDASLESMLEFDPRYEYARGLNKLNRLLHATRWDWSRRHWVGRTIRGGYVEVRPDTYSPAFLRDLTRYVLQLDYDEHQRAARAGEPPKFHILPLDMMIAVDALQNLAGLCKPFAIWADYRDIWERGIRYDIPDVPAVPATPLPATRYLYVGTEWDDGMATAVFSGMRSDYLEGVAGDTPCVPRLTPLKNGAEVWDLMHQSEFEVDRESAAMLFQFELDTLLDKFDAGAAPGGITAAYRWYALYGCLRLSSGQLAMHDAALRRTAQKDRHGLTLSYSVEDLVARSVSFVALPPDVQALWEGQRAGASQLALPL